MLLAGVPKAERLGREAFGAQLCRALTERDMLVLDAGALRRLDRVDTLVIDGGLLTTGGVAVSGLRLLEGADAPQVHRRLSLLFDPTDPTVTHNRGRWELGPITRAEQRRLDVRHAGAGRWCCGWAAGRRRSSGSSRNSRRPPSI